MLTQLPPTADESLSTPLTPHNPLHPARLFDSIQLRDVRVRNRVVVSPMCQYSIEDQSGVATDWHLVHLGGFAVGGAGIVFTEATAVEARGRISPQDLGLWNDAQMEPLARITRFVTGQGAVPGIQLAHAGRKASTARPWDEGALVDTAHGGWTPIGPSAIPFAPGYATPDALTQAQIQEVIAAFAKSAERALAAGFQIIELHAAHGYLLHEFLSPVSNQRTDEYGGSFANRARLTLEVVRAIRRVWPERLPLAVRVSATDWLEDEPERPSWTVEQTVELARLLRAEGVDAMDCSSGGNVSGVRIPAGPGYQVAFAERVRREAAMRTIAVGMITQPAQADQIIRSGQADMVALAREELRNPHWPLLAAAALKQEITWPSQYERAK